jgi:hypothetical protein
MIMTLRVAGSCLGALAQLLPMICVANLNARCMYITSITYTSASVTVTGLQVDVHEAHNICSSQQTTMIVLQLLT